jgi:outer membrane protein assembly factor BamE
MHSVLISIVCSIVLVLTAGCYKVDIRQGNYIDQAMVDELKPGMTKNQVQFLLGTPLLSDPFHADRWDYVYRFKPAYKPAEQRHISLFFKGDLLSRVEGSVNPQP